MTRLGLDQRVLARRKRTARGLLRQVIRRPANRRLWNDYQQMLADGAHAPSLHRPGRFWDALQHALARELADETLHGFKRTINTRFSGFSPGESIYFDYTLHDIRRRLLERDHLGLLNSLAEPDLGNPHTLEIDGLRVSIDLLQSISELYAMSDGWTDLSGMRTVLEVGSGYGRVADVAYRATGGACCYCLADLPLPLALAQNYLRELHPTARILEYGTASSHAETTPTGTVTAEVLGAYDFVFLAPWEISLLADRSCDIAVNINSFQEMTREQVRWYVQEFARISRCRIYLKEWFTFDNLVDKVRIGPQDMTPDPNWSREWFRASFPFPLWDEMLFTIQQDTA